MRWVIAAVLVLSAVAKAARPTPTLDVLGEVWGFGPGLATLALYTLCAVEVALAVLLVQDRWPRLRQAGAWGVLGLLAVFAASITMQIITGSTRGCGCGLSLEVGSPLVRQLLGLGKNGLLAGMCLTLVDRRAVRRAFSNPLKRRSEGALA